MSHPKPYGVHFANGPAPDKFDDVLLPFVALMRRELHANTDKGDRPGWLKMSANVALLEVVDHVAKLYRAVRDNNGPGIQEHAADTANAAMMLLDVCGGIGAEQAVTPPPACAHLFDAEPLVPGSASSSVFAVCRYCGFRP